MNIRNIQVNKNSFIESVALRLDDTVNIRLNITLKFNRNEYIDFNLKVKDTEEILDIIYSNYWFNQRELNVIKKYDLKPRGIPIPKYIRESSSCIR